jgi:sarcosine reductase
MKLTLEIANIKDIQYGEKTLINRDALFINLKELQGLLGADKRFSKVDVELVHPGDECRLVRIFDIVEPRFRLQGENFPGILGNLQTVGDGHTLVLRGTSVVTIDLAGDSPECIFDMTGPMARYNIYSNLNHVVLQCHPAEGITREDYYNALRIANLKAATYLGEACQGFPADEVETYALPSLFEISGDTEKLPRIAYIYQIDSLQQYVGTGGPVIYGDDAMRLLPTIVHPNEILDGALVRSYHFAGQETYSIQNHALIKELYKRHGKELCFAGVIVVVATANTVHRQISAMMASKLAKSVLGADGVILTKTGGGAPHSDMGWTAELCEEAGMKTVMIVHEMSNNMTSEGSLLYSSEKVDAIVNVGSWDKQMKSPPVPRVVGGPVNINGKAANEDIEINIHSLFGALNPVGASRLMMYEI